jgi:hypothetical protein
MELMQMNEMQLINSIVEYSKWGEGDKAIALVNKHDEEVRQQAVESARKEWEIEDGSAVKDFVALQEQVEKLKQEAVEKAMEEVRDELYDMLPTGEVSAFDLIKIIQKEIDSIDARWPKAKEASHD